MTITGGIMTFDEWKNLSPESRLRLDRYAMDAERMARKVILHQDQTGITEADIEAAKRILESEARILPKENYVTVRAVIPPELRGEKVETIEDVCITCSKCGNYHSIYTGCVT